jgi:hypothetical protein
MTRKRWTRCSRFTAPTVTTASDRGRPGCPTEPRRQAAKLVWSDMQRGLLAARGVPALTIVSAIFVACANAGPNVVPPPRTGSPVSDPPADTPASSSAASVPSSSPMASAKPPDPPAACTPNRGAHCTSDQDCAQCADVLTRDGLTRVRVTTAVECVDAVCKKTGCPVQRCPQGQYCEGCEVNLPCRCRPAN